MCEPLEEYMHLQHWNIFASISFYNTVSVLSSKKATPLCDMAIVFLIETHTDDNTDVDEDKEDEDEVEERRATILRVNPRSWDWMKLQDRQTDRHRQDQGNITYVHNSTIKHTTRELITHQASPPQEMFLCSSLFCKGSIAMWFLYMYTDLLMLHAVTRLHKHCSVLPLSLSLFKVCLRYVLTCMLTN